MKKFIKTLIHYVVFAVVGFVLIMTIRLGIVYLTGYDIITRQPVIVCEDMSFIGENEICNGPVRTFEEVNANE